MTDTPAEKARKTLLNVAIDRDELAFRIMQKATGLKPPPYMTAAIAKQQVERAQPGMWAVFLDQADAAVLYFHECVNAARQPA